MPDHLHIWAAVTALGLGTFLIRFSFLGLIGDRPLPRWLTRHLRFTSVAVLPGLVAPLVVFPQATGGALDLPRLAAASVTLGIAMWRRSVLPAILSGAATLYGLMWLTGSGPF